MIQVVIVGESYNDDNDKDFQDRLNKTLELLQSKNITIVDIKFVASYTGETDYTKAFIICKDKESNNDICN